MASDDFMLTAEELRLKFQSGAVSSCLRPTALVLYQFSAASRDERDQGMAGVATQRVYLPIKNNGSTRE